MNGGRWTILVVDDVPDDIVILDEILKKEYQVKAVTNGEAALKIAQGEVPPDLILLDVMMPGMDGFEVCRRLKQDAAGAQIPVIFLTAKVMSADEKMGLELGAVDYIKKPIEPELVLARIRLRLEQKDQAIRSSEVRFRRLFETSMDGIMVVDNETGLVVDANPSMAKIMGVSEEYFLGKRFSELGDLPKILPDLRSPLDPPRRYSREADEPIETGDGRRVYLEFTCNSYTVNKREISQLNFRDITERKTAQERLEALLREKSVLLREIHHRVNNNVQIMMGLLNLSSDQVKDPELHGKLADIAHRMQSMATIHQQFYESADMSRIDFAIYLKKLHESLQSKFPDAGANATVVCELGEVLLNLEKAIPAGLIVNELLTNSMKFAFPEGRSVGTIKTTQRLAGEFVEVEVQDDGIGFPDDFDPLEAETLGMVLVRILSDQLGGTVEFRRESGTHSILRFRA